MKASKFNIIQHSIRSVVGERVCIYKFTEVCYIHTIMLCQIKHVMSCQYNTGKLVHNFVDVHEISKPNPKPGTATEITNLHRKTRMHCELIL